MMERNLSLMELICIFRQGREQFCFDWYNKYDAKHVVLHPQGYIDNFRDESRESRQAACWQKY